MCTLTAIPGSLLTNGEEARRGRLRLVFNRDELRTRPRAEPPRVVEIGTRRVLMPIDPAGGGTWIAASDAGLVFALLNVTPGVVDGDAARPGPVMPRSRGSVIPALAQAESLGRVEQLLPGLPLAELAPFRLVALTPEALLEARWTGGRLQRQHRPFTEPWLTTSSSLGDRRVAARRRALFARRTNGRIEGWQDAFHRHRWPDRPELSVLMERRDARTVSVTTIELARDRVQMRYEPIEPDAVEEVRELALIRERRPETRGQRPETGDQG